MARRMTRTERKAAFLAAAEQRWHELEAWYDAHPAATFEEIEGEARRQRRELMGEGLSILVNGRDTGATVEPPACGACGQPLRFKGYRARTVRGLEGDTRLERAYYVCARCDAQTLFPPGPPTGAAR